MNKFIEKNQLVLFCISIFFIMLLLYSKYQNYQAKSAIEDMERIEAENNLKAQNEQIKADSLSKQEYVLEQEKAKEEKRKLYINKQEELESAYLQLEYFFGDFKIDALGFIQSKKFNYYLFDVQLSYNSDEQKTIISCKDGKGKCIKYTQEFSPEDYLDYGDAQTHGTVNKISYRNQTVTEFEKAKSAFEKYKRLFKEIEQTDTTTFSK